MSDEKDEVEIEIEPDFLHDKKKTLKPISFFLKK